MSKITFHDKNMIKKFFNEGGYVLDFSNRTFDKFTYHSIGVKIQEKYGLSKGKSFEAYIDEALDNDIIKLVRDLLTYYDDLPDSSSEKTDIKNKQAEKLKEMLNSYAHMGKEIIKTDESFLTKGGFAEIYLQKHSQRIVKKLKNEYKQNSALKSRFKREFEIMQSLSQVNGIIKVYEFDESEFSYTMEKADFGLAKDSTVNHSHLTMNTNNYGQFYYCAPEQITGLKNATKMSDVYSLGKVVNFCLTGNPTNEKHVLRTFVQKATSYQPELRFRDAGEMLEQLSYHLRIFHQKDSKQKILKKIQQREYDETITIYLNNISNVDLCRELIDIGENYKLACIKFMKISPENALFLIQKLFPSLKEVATSFSSNDIFASLAFDVLKDEHFDYLSKEMAARMLYYVAREVNRFYAQRLIEDLKHSSIEPMLENILDGE